MIYTPYTAWIGGICPAIFVPAVQVKIIQTKQQISLLAYLAENGHSSLPRVATALGRRVDSVRRQIQKLVKKGWLIKCSDERSDGQSGIALYSCGPA